MWQFNELAAEISGIDHFQKVIEQLDEQRFVRKWCGRQMFEAGLK
jgi:hypothetical protein